MKDRPIDLRQAAVLTPTSLRHELPRARLLHRIEAAADAKIVALLAPSGFGKTTLLSQYARATSRPVAWLTLSENDADPAVLARSVAHSLKSTFTAALGHWTPDPAVGAEVLGAQIAELLSASDQNVGIVLDGAQHLGASAAEWLEGFVARLQEGHQVLVSGYEGQALRLARWVAQNQALVIGSDDLSFTAAECEAYLHTAGYAHDPTLPYQALEGWPAGLSLVASGASRYLSPETLVYDAMAQLPPPVQAALPEAAVVPVWSELLVRRVSSALPPGWLDAVRRAGLPLTPLRPGVFRPHGVLVRALDQLLAQDPDRYAALHARAGQLAEREGDALQALRQYQLAGQDEEALRLAASLVPQWMRQLEYRLVREALAPFIPADLPQHLAVQLALALLESGDVQGAEQLLRTLERQGQPSALLHYALANMLVRRGQLHLALDHVTRALDGEAGDDFTTLKLLRLKAYVQVSLHQFEAAAAAATLAVDHATALGDLHEQASSLSILASISLSMNHLTRAERATEQAIAIYEQLSLTAGAAGLYNDLAQIYRVTDRGAEALGVLQQVLPGAQRDHSRYLPALLETLGDVHFWQGDAPGAVQAYEDASRACEAQGNRLLQVRVRYKLTDALRRAGQPGAAQQLLGRLRTSMHHEDALMQSLPPFYEGLQAFAVQDFARAATCFQTVLNGPGRPDRAARAAAYAAEILRAQGGLTDAALAPLAGRLDALGSAAVLRGDPALTPLLEHCAAHGLLAPHLSDAAPRPVTIPPPTHGRQVLRLDTLGRFTLTLADQPLKVTVAKARELLVWLALEGGGSRDQIIDALWDGSNEYRHVEYFKVTVRRLRAVFTDCAALTGTPLLFEGGVYRLSEHFDVEVDVHGLHSALRRADLSALRQHLEHARGPFLSDIDAAWTERWRDQAQAELFAAALILAADPQGTPEQVRWAFERAIALEPLAREGHEGLILYLQRRGELEAARLAYRSYARLLEQELGEPVPEAFRAQCGLST